MYITPYKVGMHESIGQNPQIDVEVKDHSVFREGNPWRVVVDLNEACNIQCTYCHIDALYGIKARNSRTLSPKLVRDLLLDADQMQVFDVTFTGGEITTMPNLSEYLRGISDLRFSSVQLITNGTLLTRKLARELKDSGLQRVSISIDGPEISNDQARGNGVWQKAWRGLENAVEAGLIVNVISVLGMHNIDDWHRFPEQLKAVGARSQNISLMCRLGRAESTEEWLGVPENRLDEIRKIVKELEILNDDTYFITLNDGVTKQPGWSGETTPLHAFQDQNPGIEAVVKVDGEILRNRLYGKDRIIGNLTTGLLSTHWYRDRIRRQQMIGVVGTENVGVLPTLYYHYDPDKVQLKQVNIPGQTREDQSTDVDLRTRVENWGSIVFDRRTFSIVDVRFAENNNG